MDMECQGCVYYKYEVDTNFAYCAKGKGQEFDQENEVPCEDYYAVEEAKADAKYGHCDKY
jgi:hypothetical protein